MQVQTRYILHVNKDLDQVRRLTEEIMLQYKLNFVDYTERFLKNEHSCDYFPGALSILLDLMIEYYELFIEDIII
jgi:hypothetical protein